MLEEIKEKFESKPFFIVSTISIILSLVLLLLKEFKVIALNSYIDTAWITIIISGYPIVFEAIEELKEKHISSELLVTIALISSIILGEIFAAGEVCFIMAIGEALENMTVNKARKGLEKLVNLMPKEATLIIDDKEIVKSIDEININDIIRVKPGEKISMDGVVINGRISADQSILTGESMPIDKVKGDLVYQGTINLSGSIDFKVTKVSTETTLSKMISLINDANNNEAPIKRIADKWASILVPVSLLIAIITGILTYVFIGKENNAPLIRAVTILVTFCPCALTLATPTSVMAGIGQATKYGVLIKSGEAIEELGRTNLICFDKTGTLTQGKIEVNNVIGYSISKDEVIKIAASLESKSEHPISKAIYKMSSSLYQVEEFNSILGSGITGIINKEFYKIGSINFCKDLLTKEIEKDIEVHLEKGDAVVLLSNNKEILGLISLSDALRSESISTIKELKSLNFSVNLLTGDNKKIADNIGDTLGIENVYSELLPTDKVDKIKEFNSKGYKTIMVGDGINDAPSLKTASIGIAMGGIASDITTSSAKIVLLKDNIDMLPYAIKLSRKTLNTIKLNITLSIIINIIAVTLSAFGLLTPITGAIVHNLGSVLVVLNSALLIDRKVK